MIKTLGKLKDLLTTSPGVHIGNRLDIFLPIDAKAVAKRLELEAKAKERGLRDEPTPSAESFDDIEHDIVLFVEGERSRCQSILTSEVTTYDERLSRLRLEHQVGVLTDLVKEATAEFAAQIAGGRDALHLARRDVVEQERHLISFRRKNGLDRPAVYPESQILRGGLIAALLLVEAVANGFFFAKGSDFGLFGGVMQALIVASVNILAALLVSRTVLRWIWHSSGVWKFIGSLGLAIYVTFMLILNLFVGHYREALALNALNIDPATAAVQSFAQAPFNLTHFESWILVIVGILFAIVAMIDGYSMDDRYPGYGDVDREYRRRVKKYADDKATLLDDLRQTRDDTSSTIRQLREDLSKKRGEHDSALAGRRSLIEHFREHLNHLEAAGRSLLATYRVENKKHRSKPAPKHFDQLWSLTRPRDPDPPITRPPSDLDLMIAAASSEAEKAAETLYSCFQDGVTQYDQIDNLIPEEKLND